MEGNGLIGLAGAIPVDWRPSALGLRAGASPHDPADIAGGDRGLSPHEAIMGAVGACVATGFIVQATARSVKIDSLEVHVDGQL